MTTIQYREIILDGCRHAEIVDEQHSFDLKHFAEACGQSPEWVLQLLEYDILPNRPDNRIHQFFGDDVSRARRAYRLQRDFDASFTAVAMMLDLIEEVQKLRREVKHLHLTDPVQTTQHQFYKERLAHAFLSFFIFEQEDQTATMKLKVCNKKTKLMFPEYRDMIQQLREDNPHFSKMFDDHEALDQEICLLEQDPVRIHRGEIEPLKRKKLFIKDQLYRILKGAQLKTS